MTYNPDIHHRRSIRLKGYDYALPGAYFVTICTHGRACVFGDIVDGVMMLNDVGMLAQREWCGLTERFPHLAPDAFIVMPNHLHCIIAHTAPENTSPVGARFIAPQRAAPQFISPNDVREYVENQGAGNVGNMGNMGNQGAINRTPTVDRVPTVGEIVRAFKAVTTRRIRLQGIDDFAWQRNYYEHIIRNETSLRRIREYIHNNPLQWALDRENPANTAGQGEP